MYLDYWHLKEKPFENNWDLRFYYFAEQHQEMLSRLLYTVRERRQGVIFSGRYGSGKSLILRMFLKKMIDMQQDYKIIYVIDPLSRTVEFYQEFLRQLGLHEVPTGRMQLINQFKEQLVKVNDTGGHTIIIVDEAHLINNDTLEDLRLLLNLYHPKTDQALLSIILAGQFQLDEKIQGNPALTQRLPIRCKLELLTEEQTSEYVFHRLRIAGQSMPIFTPEAIQLIYRYSQGTPRVINNCCDLALFLGFSQSVARIEPELVELVAKEIEESL
jgi:general secretion pathway protein A